MTNTEHELERIKQMLLIKYPTFGSDIAKVCLKINNNLPSHTAATDGNVVYFDEEFLKTLTDQEKMFLIAHEIMHIKFEHVNRMQDKDGQMRNMLVWNIATDAIINENLKKDGIEPIEGGVSIDGAINFTSEQLYDILLEKKKQRDESKKKQNGSSQSSNQENDKQNSNSDKAIINNEPNEENKACNRDNNQQNGIGQGNGTQKYYEKARNSKESDLHIPDDIFDKKMQDDHSLWGEKKDKDSFLDKFKNKTKNKDYLAKKQEKEKLFEKNVDENSAFNKNREERIKKAKEEFEKLQRQQMDNFSPLVDSFETMWKPRLNWKQILKAGFEKDDAIWSQRRSIQENNYAYRIEDYETDDGTYTEVLVDVSGSVNRNLVMMFLNEIKQIFKDSKLKVGCFDNRFYGFKEINKKSDLETAVVMHGGGTDFNIAINSFSKKSNVNKIVFTDGCGKYTGCDSSVTWVVYDNPAFKLKYGKVIHLNVREMLKDMDYEITF